MGRDGTLTSTKTSVSDKIPPKDIIQLETKRLHAAGILNIAMLIVEDPTATEM